MKVALVTTPSSVRSGIGDYTRHLVPYLREHCEVQVFVDPAFSGRAWLESSGERARGADELNPRAFDQIVYQLGNERSHAFMPRMIRALGGTVVQHDWVLFDLALATFPALARGGAKGHALALREGGLRQARVYLRNWIERRRQRRRPAPLRDASELEGTLLYGWHEPEADGRWTTDHAGLRIPDDQVEEVRFEIRADRGREIAISEEGRLLFRGSAGVHRMRSARRDRPLLLLSTDGIRVTKEQRRHGDSRRLGCFVQRIAWRGARGERELDLRSPCALRETMINLARDRFELPLNRSVVRFADAFIVHSQYVGERILRERNAATPIGVVHHGAERRWKDEDRRETRRKLGLDGAWLDSFLVASFGGVQYHKRIESALQALALARQSRGDVRLVLAGSLDGEFDPRPLTAKLGLEDAVRFTGFVPEEKGWEWLHAGDVALNLRGPSSGGTSGGIFQAFSVGRPVIASDAAEQKELPDSCTVKVPLDGVEVEALARTLVELRDDPHRRAELEAAARRFVDEECHWGIVAKRYVEHLESFPRARSARRRLVARAHRARFSPKRA